MHWTQFPDAQNQLQGGGVMGECCNELRCCDYRVPQSVCSCVLDKPVI